MVAQKLWGLENLFWLCVAIAAVGALFFLPKSDTLLLLLLLLCLAHNVTGLEQALAALRKKSLAACFVAPHVSLQVTQPRMTTFTTAAAPLVEECLYCHNRRIQKRNHNLGGRQFHWTVAAFVDPIANQPNQTFCPAFLPCRLFCRPNEARTNEHFCGLQIEIESNDGDISVGRPATLVQIILFTARALGEDGNTQALSVAASIQLLWNIV